MGVAPENSNSRSMFFLQHHVCAREYEMWTQQIREHLKSADPPPVAHSVLPILRPCLQTLDLRIQDMGTHNIWKHFLNKRFLNSKKMDQNLIGNSVLSAYYNTGKISL